MNKRQTSSLIRTGLRCCVAMVTLIVASLVLYPYLATAAPQDDPSSFRRAIAGSQKTEGAPSSTRHSTEDAERQPYVPRDLGRPRTTNQSKRPLFDTQNSSVFDRTQYQAKQETEYAAPLKAAQRIQGNAGNKTFQPNFGDGFGTYLRQTLRPVTETVIRKVPVQTTRTYRDPKTGEMKTKVETTYRNEQSTVTRYIPEREYVKIPHADRVNELVQDIVRAGEPLTDEAEEDVSKKRQELERMLEEQFDVMHAEQQKQIDQLAKRLERLQNMQNQREEAKDRIVTRRLQTLLRQPDPLAWNPAPLQPQSAPTTTYRHSFPIPHSVPPATGNQPGQQWNNVPSSPVPMLTPRYQPPQSYPQQGYPPATVAPRYPQTPALPRAPQQGQTFLLDQQRNTQDHSQQQRSSRLQQVDDNERQTVDREEEEEEGTTKPPRRQNRRDRQEDDLPVEVEDDRTDELGDAVEDSEVESER